MRLYLNKQSLTLVGIISLSAFAVGADELVNACNTCHSPDKTDVPVISGISAFTLEEALKAYTDDTRKARVFDGKDMKTELEALSGEQIKKLIAHYSAQKFTPIKQAVDAGLVAQGAKLHKMHCEKCHTESGALAEDDSSILAGQWKGYLVEEMKQFKAGGRTGDKKMLDVLKGMNDEQIKALAEFYASQQ